MLKLERKHIDAILSSSDLLAAVSQVLDDPTLVSRLSKDLSDHDYDVLSDACHDALLCEAPAVREHAAEQDKGAYCVTVRGVPGAYFFSAPEYDNEGVFSSVAEAEAFARAKYGEFFIDDSNLEEGSE